jgi:hypothetical protein
MSLRGFLGLLSVYKNVRTLTKESAPRQKYLYISVGVRI